MSNNTPFKSLPYSTFQGVIAAFAAGVKFAVVGGAVASNLGAVHSIKSSGRGIAVQSGETGHWFCFQPDGSNRVASSVRLIQVEEVQRTPDFSIARFTKDEEFVNPKTGETVCGFHVYNDRVEVEFHTGRISDNYRVDGTHKHDPARDLAPAPKTKTMRVEIAQSHDGSFRAVVNVASTFKPKREVGAIVGLGHRIVFVNEFELPA